MLCSVTFICSYGQTNEEWEKNQQNIESLIFDVVGSKEIKLNPANRFFDPIAPQSINREKPSISMVFDNYMYSGTGTDIRLRPRQLAAQAEEKLYSGYALLGYGNFMNPYIGAGIGSKREKEFSFGADFLYDHKFNGPIDKKNSGEGMFNSSIFYDLYADKATLYTDLRFNRYMFHYYGYDEGTEVDPEEIRANYNRLDLTLGLKSSDPEQDFQYDGRVGLISQGDGLNAMETHFLARAETSTEVIENIFVDIDGQYDYLARKYTDGDIQRHIFDVSGWARFSKNDFNIKAGANFALSPDTLAQQNGVKFSPLVEVDYMAATSFRPYFGIGGGINRHSWSSRTQANPFLVDAPYIANEIVNIELHGGIKGRISEMFSYEAGFQIAELVNSGYFANDEVDLARFQVVYDSGTVSLMKPFVALKFNKKEKYRAGIGIEYNKYSMDQLDIPYHRPTTVLHFNTGMNLVDKIQVDVLGRVLLGMEYVENDLIESIDTFTDLSAKITYKASGNFSANLEFQNILNNDNMMYNRYPMRGIQVPGGIVYRF